MHHYLTSPFETKTFLFLCGKASFSDIVIGRGYIYLAILFWSAEYVALAGLVYFVRTNSAEVNSELGTADDKQMMSEERSTNHQANDVSYVSQLGSVGNPALDDMGWRDDIYYDV